MWRYELKWLVDVKVRTEMISWCEGKNWNDLMWVKCLVDVKVRTEMFSWCEGKNWNDRLMWR